MTRREKLMHPATFISLAALFVALGGVGYAATKIGTKQLRNRAVTGPKLANNSVTSPKIRAGAVRNGDLANNSVSTSKVQNRAIINADLALGSVLNANLGNGAVTSEKIGTGAARRYFLTGERFDAEVALQIGLVHEVAPELDAAVDRVVGELLTSGPAAAREAKALIRRRSREPQELAQLAARLRTSDEGQEGLRAFLDKRSPAWRSESSS